MLVFLLLGGTILAQAEDGRLDAIRGLLEPMRSEQSGNLKARGATPAMTTVKHLLREWIESRVSTLRWNGVRWDPDPVVLQEQLNDELRRAELFCDVRLNAGCPQWSERGFLGPLILDTQQGNLLVVRTAVGVQQCGYDESAYAYELNGNQWRKFWQSEQNDYQEGKYFPQRLEQVQISRDDFRPKADKAERLILTLGVEPWCSSNRHDVYYRVWQTRAANNEPVMLLDGSEWAFVDAPIRGTAGPTGVFIEYQVSSVEGGFIRPEIRHYVLQQGRLERADPVALTPRDFAAFWLRHPWPESSRWTAKESRQRLEEWRQTHKGPFWEFDNPTLHCERRPDLWQVSTDAGEEGAEHVYFLMRWRPPYYFTMVSVSGLPSPDCGEIDREADEPRSLFSVQ